MLINRETGKSYSVDLEEDLRHHNKYNNNENSDSDNDNNENDGEDCMEHLIEHHHHELNLMHCYCDDNSKKDGRLFHEYPLYCEGHPKPICRGILHLICALILPTILLIFIRQCYGSYLAIFISCSFLLSNMMCYGISGIYHIFDWTSEYEILLQKLDHCGIAILSVGTILPDAILLFGSNLSPNFPNILGYTMALISILLCSYTCSQIMKQKPSITLQAVVAAWWVLPFLIPNYYYMNTIEFSSMLGCCFLQGCGVYVFTNQFPDFFPTYFGYHEIFHILITGAGMCVIICNYSIVTRYGIAYQLGQV